MPSQEWPEARTLLLRTLWAEGHSASEIGRRLGVTGNAVVGKAHRLHLPERGSPIRPMGSGKQPYKHKSYLRPPPLPPLPLPPLASVVAAVAETRVPETPVVVVVKAERSRPVSRETPQLPRRVLGQCQFIFGDRPRYRTCDEPCVLNARGLPSPWCREHSKLCTSGVPALRSEAA